MRIGTHADVLEAFGGLSGLAKLIGVPYRQASHWKTRGIPSRHWHKVEEIARERGLPVTCDVLETIPRTSDLPPVGQRSRRAA